MTSLDWTIICEKLLETTNRTLIQSLLRWAHVFYLYICFPLFVPSKVRNSCKFATKEGHRTIVKTNNWKKPIPLTSQPWRMELLQPLPWGFPWHHLLILSKKTYLESKDWVKKPWKTISKIKEVLTTETLKKKKASHFANNCQNSKWNRNWWDYSEDDSKQGWNSFTYKKFDAAYFLFGDAVKYSTCCSGCKTWGNSKSKCNNNNNNNNFNCSKSTRFNHFQNTNSCINSSGAIKQWLFVTTIVVLTKLWQDQIVSVSSTKETIWTTQKHL